MKRIIFSVLLLLGVVATGSSQVIIRFSGYPTVTRPSANVVSISCNGGGTCATLGVGGDNKIHLKIPAFNADFVLATESVNGTPIRDLPSQLPNGTYNFNVVP